MLGAIYLNPANKTASCFLQERRGTFPHWRCCEREVYADQFFFSFSWILTAQSFYSTQIPKKRLESNRGETEMILKAELKQYDLPGEVLKNKKLNQVQSLLD